jgi:uncharacterized membrane protein YeaQ/YmgE (transglycosylase-associated protein family)
MGILLWIVIGAVAGWLASIITRRNDSMNWLENIIVGIIGGLVGGFLVDALFDSDGNRGLVMTLIVATIGATLLLFVYGAIRGDRNRS